jgi:hypothetical protein
MEKHNLKRSLTLVAGSLVVALAVSILPGSFFVSAEEVSKTEAEKIALEKLMEFEGVKEDTLVNIITSKINPKNAEPYYSIIIKTEDGEYDLTVYSNDGKVQFENKLTEEEAENLALRKVLREYDDLDEDDLEIIDVDNEQAKDYRRPYYIVTIKDTEENEYEVKVYIHGERAVIVDDKDKNLEEISTTENFEEFKNQIGAGKIEDVEDAKEFDLDNEEYINYDEKQTTEASLNMLLNDGKKAAISDFKETGNKEEFKTSKEILQVIKKNEKAEIKEDKKDKDYEDDSLIKNAKLREEDAKAIALDYAAKDLDFKDAISLLKERKLTDFDIDKDDDNPPAYEISFCIDDKDYEFVIHAITGRILDLETEKVKNERNTNSSNKYEDENDDDHIDKKAKSSNKEKNQKDNNNKSNNGKNNNKNNK